MAKLQPAEGVSRAPHPTSDEVRAYLSALIRCRDFNASDRNRRFLRYVVEETLEGRADRIKAYNIALAAFDRGEDFDPLTDPIVRIEARRLRQSLEHYYLTAGKADEIRIQIPKGSYSATFGRIADRPVRPQTHDAQLRLTDAPAQREPTRRGRSSLILVTVAILLLGISAATYALLAAGRQANEASNQAHGPAVLIVPFEFLGSDPANSYLARGLTYDVTGALTRFEDLYVYGSETSFDITGAPAKLAGITPDYIVSGSVQTDGSKIRASTILADAHNNEYLWSATTERDLSTSGFAEIQDEIVTRVVAAIAQPSGFLFEETARAVAAKPAGDLTSYECVVRFRQYWASYSDRDFEPVRGCLERTVATDPNYASAYSSLALLYVDSYRFGFGASKLSFDPLQRARELSDKAISLEPDASSGYLAKSMTLWFLHDLDGSIRTARRGLQINPLNTDLMADLGLRLAQRARWDEAMPLIDEAYARNPGAPVGYHTATFLHQYMTGDYRAALESAKKVQTPAVLYGPAARAISYAQLGQMDEAKAEVAEILKIDPDYGSHVREDLAKRNHVPEIIEAVVQGLEKAGLRAGVSADQ